MRTMSLHINKRTMSLEMHAYPEEKKMVDYHKECRRPLTHGLPDEVRDTAVKSTTPDYIRKFFADLKMGNLGYSAKHEPRESILKRQRTGKVFMWKEATICTFYGSGSGCERGDNCPYRHVMPNTGELSQHKRKENNYYYREIGDPVAMKILRLARARNLEAPEEERDNPC